MHKSIQIEPKISYNTKQRKQYLVHSFVTSNNHHKYSDIELFSQKNNPKWMHAQINCQIDLFQSGADLQCNMTGI